MALMLRETAHDQNLPGAETALQTFGAAQGRGGGTTSSLLPSKNV